MKKQNLFLILLCASLAAPNAAANAIDHLQTTDDIGINKVPNAGPSRILVIPSRVADTFPPAAWERLQTRFGPEVTDESFSEYWRKQSNGAYTPTTVLADPILLDECPLPGRDETNCEFLPTDLELIQNGEFRRLFKTLIEKVRDEQGIDLAQFDINGVDGNPDGYFDGVIISTEMYSGVGLPLAALSNSVVVETTPRPIVEVGDAGVPDAGATDAGPQPDAGPTGPTLEVGIVALIPPDIHEFGHNLGFLDLYGGPTVTGLMGKTRSGLCAFSRLAIGWGDEEIVSGALSERVLEPVTSGGTILRIGEGSKYLLIENRGGPNFDYEGDDIPGVYVYSVDESAFPTGPLGFLDLQNGDLFLSNRREPYLNVNVPLNCNDNNEDFGINTCAMLEGGTRNLIHSDGEDTGFHLVVNSGNSAQGNVTISIVEGSVAAADAGPIPDAGEGEGESDAGDGPPEDDEGCGCESTILAQHSTPKGALSFAVFALLVGVLGSRRNVQKGSDDKA